ncbi:MAG: aldo/keto reductase [Rhizobiaceae bacterium]|nr:aldo/keto reductase [Rhizobiaceae bacterium]
MELRNLGRSGLRVSRLGLGCNTFGMRCDADQSKKIVDAAIEAGINFFDTSDSYSEGKSESFLGKALGSRRADVAIATKFASPMGPGRQGASRRYIHQAVEASLTRLGTDWIDLYQVHFPDPHTPIEETVSTLEDLKRQGKIRYYGCSNFSPVQLTEAALTARLIGADGFMSTQSEYSLLARDIEAETLPCLDKYGMSLLPYFPLASGLLSGKYGAGGKQPANSRLVTPNVPWLERQSERLLKDENLSTVASLEDFATKQGHSLLSLALCWVASNPVVGSVIAGASSADQVTANAAVMDWHLSSDEFADVAAILK